MGLLPFRHIVRQQNRNDGPSSGFLAESRQPEMIIGNILAQFIGCLFFFARAYSRAIITKAWKAEDYVLTLAWICVTGYSTCQYMQIINGYGRHSAALENPQDEVRSQMYAYAAQILLLPGLATPKLSICLSYLRIFYNDTQGRRMIKALIIILLVSIIPFSFEAVFQCKPIYVYWTEFRPNSKCRALLPALYVNGSLNATIDIGLIAIVLPRVLELQLHNRQRWALTGIVMLGSLAVVAGIVRMVRVGTTISQPDFEPSWDSYDVSIWTSTELYVSLICASAPGVKPVVVKFAPKLLGSSLRTRTKTISTSIELGPRWKRTTIGSTRMKRLDRESMLATVDGMYTECGRGRDEENLIAENQDLEGTGGSLDGGIRKKSEISIRSSILR